MSYFLSSDPLPQNSAVAPPADTAMDARRWANYQASSEGRERVYANIPTVTELYFSISPELAKNADGILNASETGRESVLIGVDIPVTMFQPPTLADIQAAAPVVVPANSSVEGIALMAPVVVMPGRAEDNPIGAPISGPEGSAFARLMLPRGQRSPYAADWGNAGPVSFPPCGGGSSSSSWLLAILAGVIGYSLFKKGRR